MRFRTSSVEAEIRVKRRREEVANLYFLEGYTIQEIAENSVYSARTIQRDVNYIKTHMKEFFYWQKAD